MAARKEVLFSPNSFSQNPSKGSSRKPLKCPKREGISFSHLPKDGVTAHDTNPNHYCFDQVYLTPFFLSSIFYSRYERAKAAARNGNGGRERKREKVHRTRLLHCRLHSRAFGT